MSMTGSSDKHLYSIILVIIKLKGLVEISFLSLCHQCFISLKYKNISRLSLTPCLEGSPFKILLGKINAALYYVNV